MNTPQLGLQNTPYGPPTAGYAADAEAFRDAILGKSEESEL